MKDCETCKGTGKIQLTVQEALEQLCDEALDAVDCVGLANYPERQTEARDKVLAKCYELLEELA